LALAASTIGVVQTMVSDGKSKTTGVGASKEAVEIPVHPFSSVTVTV